MADSSFRGVVLGSPWRRGYGTIPADLFRQHPDVVERVNRGEAFPGVKSSYWVQSDAVDPLIRRSLFYFDTIVLPTNNLLRLVDPGGVHFLRDEGELELVHIDIQLASEEIERLRRLLEIRGTAPTYRNPANPAEQLIQFHRNVFLERQAREPNLWMLANVGIGLELASEKSVAGYALKLVECIPVPSDLASYADIIEFKKRERSALLDLRAHLDEIHLEIAKSGDQGFAAHVSISKLEKSIEAVQGLLNKSGLPWYKQSMEADVNPGSAFKAASAGYNLGEWLAQHGVPIEIMAAAGSMLGASMLFKRKAIQPPANEGAGAFQYIHEAVKAGIVEPRRP
jgi:Family of unknown function (DUF6236)